jgi:DNA-binding NtrC family response regulator
MTQPQPSYVVLLEGNHLSSESLPASATRAVQVWCRDISELIDRAKRLQPKAVILDASRIGPGFSPLQVAEAIPPGSLIACVARRGEVLADADYLISADDDLPGEVRSFVRYALGEPARRRPRVSCPTASVIVGVDGVPAEFPLKDLSEEGFAVFGSPAHLRCEAVTLRLLLQGGVELEAAGCWVREDVDAQNRVITAYRFEALSAHACAAIRALPNRPRRRAVAVDRPAERERVKAGTSRMLGTSLSMCRIHEVLERIAPTDVTVLILGETGTGKELAARALHEGSLRSRRPFVAVNCAALPENLVESELFGHEAGAFTGANKRKVGHLEYASGGTLFLDEIGDLPSGAQAKLLRALQERCIHRVGGHEPVPVDIRLVAATNQDLEVGIAKQSFRRDLFFRLNVVSVTMPALRDRSEDISLLADHFLAQAMAQMNKRGIHMSEHAVATLVRYPWPGNIRELENLCTRVVALSAGDSKLGPEHLNLLVPGELPNSPLPSTDLRQILEFCEREIVRRMLERNGGNRTKTAQDLGISRQAIQQKLARFRAASG